MRLTLVFEYFFTKHISLLCKRRSKSIRNVLNVINFRVLNNSIIGINEFCKNEHSIYI